MNNNRLGCRNVANVRTNVRNCAVCRSLTLKLQQIDFALVDTVLYLDAYPECSKALAYYHKLLEKREEIASAISDKCGPMTSFDNTSADAWQWIEGPWPWQADGN